LADPGDQSDATQPSPGRASDPDVPIDRIGRYLVLDLIGAGGMGVVYAAYDPALDRKVAIKLLHDDHEPAQARLLREAQALARLRHRNVVAVHDAGRFRNQVFVAMELVEGTTLQRWLAERPRPWREIVRVFVEAGRGLAAAHAEGLVHRDFKPDNVLLGADGSVRVADFGLAHPVGEPDPGVVGTPRYMAPEQQSGAPVDARADQYAFCVALREALARRRRGRVPARLGALVRRGLAPAPADRHPDMDVLLRALAHDPAVARRRALGAVLLAAAAATATFGLTRAPPAPPCADPGALDGAWDPATRARLRGAFLATGSAHAEETFERVARRLDDYAAAWSAMRAGTCEATRVRGEQSDAMLDLRMACLERRRGALASLASVLAEAPDRAVLDGAVVAAARLPDLAGCADRQLLAGAIPPPPTELRPRVLAARARIDAASALIVAGRYPDGAALARAAAEEARAIPYPPVVAEALHVRFLAEVSLRDPAARAAGAEALVHAARARDDEGAARLWTRLLFLVSQGEHPAEALALLPAAEAAVARAGEGAELVAHLRNAEGVVRQALGDHAGAERAHTEALGALARAARPDLDLLAKNLNNLSGALGRQGKVAEARQALERAIAITVELLGPEHPNVGVMHANLGVLLLESFGDPLAAGRRLERARAILERLDPTSPQTALAVWNLGEVALVRGRLDEALRHHRRALAVYRRRLGPDHPRAAVVATCLADTLARRGELAEAAPLVAGALAALRRAHAGDHEDTARALAISARVHGLAGRPLDAMAHADQAVAMLERLAGRDAPRLAELLSIRAELHAARGRDDLAADDDRRALAIHERMSPAGLHAGRALAALGERTLALGRRAEATPLLERAIAILEGAGGDAARPRALLAR
jgi:tetratricopeptide (TPR) repeat protein